MSRRARAIHTTIGTAAALLVVSSLATAQFAERGALHADGTQDLDVSGRSVKQPRIRAIHTTDADDPGQAGGTANLLAKDPFLAYQLGRNLNFREFRERDGIFDALVAGFGGPMVDGTTSKITTNNQTSCLGCHNQPNGNPGGGANFAKDSGLGRNTPHYFGAGLFEMLAIQIRTALMQQIDTNADGWVSVAEADAAPDPLLVETVPGSGDFVDFGSATLDGGATGVPQLNSIFRVWYGDDGSGGGGDGGITIAEGATEVDGATATHYNFEMVVWGWGQRAPPAALNPTNRAFLWDPFKAHGGLESYDPSTEIDPDGDGVSEPTLAGAIQFPATHRAPDPGTALDPLGFSTDDPDGDGYLNEISEGDLDLAEWFMLNTPRPFFNGTEKEYKKGVKMMDKMGCTECHIADWQILAADGTYAGDRRFFDFEVTLEKISKKESRLIGSLTPLYDVVSPPGDGEVVEDDYVRRFGEFLVPGVFTDFKQHDMGDGFAELAYDGNINTRWRTSPLWGVGSGFPWGHDGASLTIEDAILRHGGDAAESGEKFAKMSKGKRRKLVEFLRQLQLFDVETLQADIDGDGVISESFMVAGQDTGVERFNAEWLFTTPVEIEGTVTNTDGEQIRSDAAVNLDAAYRLSATLRIDADEDGWPDAWDNAPGTTGYRDGVNN